ncbi:MAG: RIP metalloprotease RseP [Candidatus Acidiferrales bacterium]
MSTFLTAIISVTVVLGIMIVVHEWGHFVAAKFFGVRVEIFSIGFGPRLWGRKRGDTDYRLSALPFGGYVKMAGDNPLEERSGAPDEFLSKPRWQRVLIAVAGPAMNILLAILLMIGLYKAGSPEPSYLSQPPVVAGVLPGSPAEQAGIQVGDRILKVNDTPTPKWEDAIFEADVAVSRSSISLELDRNGETREVEIHVTSKQMLEGFESLLGYPKEPVLVERITPGMPAEKAGLKAGDEVASVNGVALTSPPQLANMIKSSGGKPLSFAINRAGKDLTVVAQPIFGDPGDGAGKRWEVGFQLGTKMVPVSYPLGEAARRAVVWNLGMTRQIGDVLVGLFSGRVSLKQLEGPVGIARASGQAARRGPIAFMNLMAVISLNLGLLNLLPIPILDGGHVFLLTIEGILRRDLSVAVKERIVQVGLVFLLGVFAFVMYSDILKLIQNH